MHILTIYILYGSRLLIVTPYKESTGSGASLPENGNIAGLQNTVLRSKIWWTSPKKKIVSVIFSHALFSFTFLGPWSWDRQVVQCYIVSQNRGDLTWWFGKASHGLALQDVVQSNLDWRCDIQLFISEFKMTSHIWAKLKEKVLHSIKYSIQLLRSGITMLHARQDPAGVSSTVVTKTSYD